MVPFTVTLNVYQTNDYDTAVVENKTYPTSISRVKNTSSGGYVYYYNIPANTLAQNTEYLAVWDITETVASVPDSIIQKIRVVYFPVLAKIPQIRMLIDKVQKQLGRVQAYEDADIIEYVTEGLKLVNSIFPITSYSEITVPSALDFYWIMAAAWYGLNAQYLLEADTSFSFSGQAVTLEADRTGHIDTELGRLWDLLTEHLPKLKLRLVRKQGLGTVATRPYAGTNLVVPMPMLSSLQRILGFDVASWFAGPFSG